MTTERNPQGYTPGPYVYRKDRTISDPTGMPLARCYADRNDVANGPLFASAPELLAALQDLLIHWEGGGYFDDETITKQARAAITKATAPVRKAGA